MKKIILPLLMLWCFISWVQPTSAFTWQKNLVSIDKPYTESVCYDGGVPVYEIDDNYITKDSPYIRAYYDKLIHHQWDTRSYAIRTSSRILQYAKPGVFQSTDDWNMYSTYLPKNVKEVMVFWPNKAHKVNFDNLTPSDRGKIIWQDVFNIKRFQSVNSGSPNSQRVNMKMFYSPGSSTPVSRDIDVNEYFSRNSEEGYECFGYTVRWCGDGVTDSNDGETCDDGKNNGKPGYCNSTCTKKPEKTYCGDGKIQKPSKNNPNGKGTTKISEECDPNHPDYKGKGTCNPKTCKLNPTPVDLSIKKYIENDDAQTASSAPLKGIGDTFNYVIKVKNIGKEQTRGTTTVYDTLPKAVKLSGTISASEWNCTTSGQQVTCTTDKKVAKDTYFPTIKIPVKVQETTETTVQNNAIVYNPNEDKAKSCLKDGKKPSANTENGGKTSTTGDTTNDKNCDQDGNNEDPAIFKIMKADLSIKKYAVSLDESNEKDGQDENDPLKIKQGSEFFYKYVVKVDGTHTKATITDTFPHQVEILDFQANGWNCKKGTKTMNGKTYPTAICTKAKAEQGTYTLKVKVKLTASSDDSNNLRNIAYVCSKETGTVKDQQNSGKNACNPDKTDPNDPDATPTDPGTCSKIATDPNYDPACIDPVSGVDLKIKKYIDSDDANSAITKSHGDTFDYVLKVSNIGTLKVTGKTTVHDILPDQVTRTATPYGDDWDCDVDGKEITCTTTKEIDAGDDFPAIRIPVKVNTRQTHTVRNNATVHNPNEKDNGCYTDNHKPTGDVSTCDEGDNNNVDPAIFETEMDKKDDRYVAVKCVTDTQVACRLYNSYTDCRNDNDRQTQCRLRDKNGQDTCRADKKDFIDNNNVAEICGETEKVCWDGIINRPSEECDTGGNTSWCKGCKLKEIWEPQDHNPTTNPGQNMIRFGIKIPTLSNVTLGYSPEYFNEHGIIAGAETNIFSVADEIKLTLNRDFPAPIKIKADKLFCLAGEIAETDGEGNIFEGDKPSSCITIGDALAQGNQFYNTIQNGSDTYVVLGEGDYLDNDTVKWANSTKEVNLFKGSKSYPDFDPSNGNVTLRDRFFIDRNTKAGDMGTISLAAKAEQGGTLIPLTSFKVQVSNALVGTTGTPVNRKIADFLDFSEKDAIIEHLKQLAKKTSISGNIDNTENPSSSSKNDSTFDFEKLNLKITNDTNVTVSTMSDLTKIRLNGNPNVFATKGDVTVKCGNKGFFEMNKKVTVIAKNITFECDTKYYNNSATASWAWIANGGNIIVKNEKKPTETSNKDGNTLKSVKRLEGVYLATKENGNGGKITSKDGKSSSEILRVIGTLYGNADDLFNSRTYARGNGAYETLTTGVILTYSNKALTHTPPLLTRFLNHYKLKRVVR